MIILLILAAITINGLVGENGIITRANLARISTEFANYKEEVELYKTNKLLENNKFNSDSLTAGKSSLEYESKPESETGNIRTVINDLDEKYINKLIIIKGKLYIMATGDTSELEIKAAQNTGIEVMPYEITEEGELLSSNKNLALQEENGTLTIPDIVTSIGEGAFSNLEGLKTIIIPGSVRTIGENAFAYNKTLEKVIMQDGVEEIGAEAFRECSKLETVEMPNSVIKIGNLAFYYDVNLQNINISSGITNIQQYTFSDCNSITEINIPEGIEKISDYVFTGCDNLQKITIPASLNSISTSAFSNCPKLKDVQIDSFNNYFVYVEGIVFNKNKTEMIIILDTAITGNTFTVPAGITTLGARQLSQYTQINTVNIPSSVTSINPDFINSNITQVNIYSDGENESPYEIYNNAIYTKGRETLVRYFGNEDSVIIEEGVKNIGGVAFRDKQISSINLPNSLEKIGGQVFSGNGKLTNLSLGANVKDIHQWFIYGSVVTNLTIDPDNDYYTVEDDILYNKDKTTLILPIEPTWTIKTFVIPEGVQKIGDYAFHGRSTMTSITIPETVTEIGISFQYCTGLKSIQIPSSVTSIHSSCFSYCTNLTEIKIDKEEGTLTGAPWGATLGGRVNIQWLK